LPKNVEFVTDSVILASYMYMFPIPIPPPDSPLELFRNVEFVTETSADQ